MCYLISSSSLTPTNDAAAIASGGRLSGGLQLVPEGPHRHNQDLLPRHWHHPAPLQASLQPVHRALDGGGSGYFSTCARTFLFVLFSFLEGNAIVGLTAVTQFVFSLCITYKIDLTSL